MKKKTVSNKLALNKKTIVNLATVELKNAHGGAYRRTFEPVLCPSYDPKICYTKMDFTVCDCPTEVF